MDLFIYLSLIINSCVLFAQVWLIIFVFRLLSYFRKVLLKADYYFVDSRMDSKF